MTTAGMSLVTSATGDAVDAAAQTQAQVFATVLTHGELSRVRIAKLLGLSASTVTKAVAPLLRDGYLTVTDSGGAKAIGRPQTMLAVAAHARSVIGIKIARHAVIGTLTDLNGHPLVEQVHGFDDGRPQAVLELVADLINDLADRRPKTVGALLGVGVGVSGHVDHVAGACRRSALLDWTDVDIAGPLSKATGLHVLVENDVNSLAISERWFGKGKDATSLAVVTIGEGIGCGLFLNGQLYTGATGMAGEFGHWCVDPQGPVCNCGATGCLEAVASYDAIVAAAAEAGAEDCADIDRATDLARVDHSPSGDAARSAFENAGAALGRSLAGLCNLLSLDRIIIAGEGVSALDLVQPSMMAQFGEHAFSSAARECEITVDEIGDRQWARGAASLAITASINARTQ
ncbi:MAG: ROK family transcriptional regulator [Gaiellales bacterium]